MPDAFSLNVPLANPFRSLAPDLAGRYAERAGGSAETGAALAAAVNAAIDRVTAGAGPHADIALAFRPDAGGVKVELSCNGRREALDVAIPVVKR